MSDKKNEVVDVDAKDLTPEKVKELQESGKQVRSQVYFLHGIYGELRDCNAIAEEIIDTDEKLVKHGLDPKEGGTFLKILGCSYLYRGNPILGNVYGIEQAKSMISNIPRNTIGRSFLLSGSIILLFIFRRRKLVDFMNVYFDSIKYHTMRLYSVPEVRLNRFAREMRRAVNTATERVLGGRWPDLYRLIVNATEFVTLMLENDCAYRFPLQDVIGDGLDKGLAARSPYHAVMKMFNLMIERQTNLTVVPGISDRTEGVPYKYKFAMRALGFILFFSPTAREIAREVLLELDIEKIKLDEADWYYCLRRNTHNYRGVSLPERLNELARIDLEKGHQYIKFKYNQ